MAVKKDEMAADALVVEGRVTLEGFRARRATNCRCGRLLSTRRGG